MIFELAQDLHDAVQEMPKEHLRHLMLGLLEEAIHRDIHFIDRHPTTLFQCMWNTCWWYDCPEAERYYDPPQTGWSQEGPPWTPVGPRLYRLVEDWRVGRQGRGRLPWLRSLHPPAPHLGTALLTYLQHSDMVLGVAFSPTGKQIATASADGTVCVWDSMTGRQLSCTAGQSGVLTCVGFFPDGLRIVCGYEWKGAHILDVHTGRKIACLTETGVIVGGVAVSRDGTTAVCALRDGTVCVWDAHTCARIDHLGSDVSAVHGSSLSSDGRRIIAKGNNGDAHIWDVHTGAELARFEGPPGHGLMAVALSPDGCTAATGSADGIVRLWDADNGKLLRSLPEHPDGVSCLAFSPDGTRIASGCLDWTVRVWDVSSDTLLRWLIGHSSHIRDVDFSADGHLVASASSDGRAAMWDIHKGEPLAQLRDGWCEGNAVAVSPDGQRIASDTYAEVVVSDVERRRPVARLKCRTARIKKIAFSPDGRRVVIAGHGKHGWIVQVWESRHARPIASFKEGSLEDVGISPNGQLLATLWEGGGLTVRHLTTRKEVLRLVFGDDLPICFAFSSDNRRIVTGHGDGVTCIWNLHNGEQIGLIQADDYAIRNVAWSSGTEEVITASRGSMRKWDVVKRQCLCTSKLACPSTTFRDSFAGVVTHNETVVVDLETLCPVAWLQAALVPIAADSVGHVWAGAEKTRPYLLMLEEAIEP